MLIELIRNEPAVLLQNNSRRVLVIADLHIGYERTLVKQEKSQSRLTERLLHQLDTLVSRIKPTEIIILGDLKHTIRSFSTQEFRNIASLLERLQKTATLTVVRGNHDADLELVVPDGATIIPSSGFKLSFDEERIFLLHGHAQPNQEILSCSHLIIGHFHPTIAIPALKERKSIHRVWVRTGWQPTILEALSQWFGHEFIEEHQNLVAKILKMKILVIPAFLDLLHGHVLNRFTSREFQGNPIYRYLDFDMAEIVMLDHTYLGRLQQLQETK
ncbi:MAG: metallophosphoesterase [Candidatus Hermodarchaeota archaeon]|nr:metallophosphoesterase [Candidatus Hermodarchaeota archaeon]